MLSRVELCSVWFFIAVQRIRNIAIVRRGYAMRRSLLNSSFLGIWLLLAHGCVMPQGGGGYGSSYPSSGGWYSGSDYDYDDDDYESPRTERERFCDRQCRTEQKFCMEDEQRRVDRCKDISRDKVEACKEKRKQSGQKKKDYPCPKAECRKDEGRCKAVYRNCYRPCIRHHNRH